MAGLSKGDYYLSGIHPTEGKLYSLYYKLVSSIGVEPNIFLELHGERLWTRMAHVGK